jgi:hypothetical protein
MGSAGELQATAVNTSLTFTSTALTTEVPFPLEYAEGVDATSWASRVAAITAGFTNGQYCVDYAKGIICGVKASSQTTLTAASYKVLNNLIPVVSVTNTPAIVTSAGTALAANSSRRGWAIQNTGTNPLFVLMGSGASTSVFHRVLKGGSGTDDGTGGSIEYTFGTIYTGIISVAGTSPRFVVTEM